MQKSKLPRTNYSVIKRGKQFKIKNLMKFAFSVESKILRFEI